jgi:hypothetical protein
VYVRETVVAVAVTYAGIGFILAAIVSLIGINRTGWYSARGRWVLFGLAGVVLLSSIVDMLMSIGSLSTQIIHGAWDLAFIGTIASMLVLDRRHGPSAASGGSALARTGWSFLAVGAVLVAVSMAWGYFG